MSSITVNKTPKGTEFKNVPNVAIVYITEYDALGNGQTITCSEMCQKVNDIYIPVNDGAKIYYANTVAKNDADKSELLGLFLERNAFNNRKFPKLSQAMKYFKEDEKGVSEVCTLVEDYAKNYAKEYADKKAKEQVREIAKKLIKMGMTSADIATATQLTEEEIEKLRSQ